MKLDSFLIKEQPETRAGVSDQPKPEKGGEEQNETGRGDESVQLDTGIGASQQ